MEICKGCFSPIPAGAGVCPRCGFSEQKQRQDYPSALRAGNILGGRYIVGKVLGQGGFGITYLAQDYKTKERVAVKEYFPDTVALRAQNGSTVSSFSGEKSEAFRYGKECFLSEAQTLSKFIGNKNIVKVHSYFEENNTAYFSMEYISGESLKAYLKRKGGRITFDEARLLILPVMIALEDVHNCGIVHRDISPDNIYLTDDGTVKLIDFGAARYSLGDRSRSLDVVLKHGYAPIEQYTRRGRQGPYTDVYSLAATIYKCITGKVPPDAVDRMTDDNIVAPSALGVDIPVEAEDALLKGLEVMFRDRYQSVKEFKDGLMSVPISTKTPPYVPLSRGGDDYPPLDEYTSQTIVSQRGYSGFSEANISTSDLRSRASRSEESKEAGEAVSTVTQTDTTQTGTSWTEVSQTGVSQTGTTQTGVSQTTGSSYTGMTGGRTATVQGGGAVIDEKPLPEKKKKKTGLIIGIAAAAVVLIAGVILALILIAGANNVKISDLTNKSLEEAQKICLEEGISLNVTEQQFSDSIEKGYIIHQDIKAGETVQKNAILNVTVSRGAGVTVPDLVGLTKEQAKEKLEKVGLSLAIDKEEFSDTVTKDTVISVSTTDRIVEKGANIKVVLSKGKEQVKVPSLTGMTEKEAKEALEKVGLKFKNGGSEYSDTVASGKAVRQDKKADTSVDKGTTVTVVFSKGKKPAPTTAPTSAPAQDSGSSSDDSGYDSSGDDSGSYGEGYSDEPEEPEDNGGSSDDVGDDGGDDYVDIGDDYIDIDG